MTACLHVRPFLGLALLTAGGCASASPLPALPQPPVASAITTTAPGATSVAGAGDPVPTAPAAPRCGQSSDDGCVPSLTPTRRLGHYSSRDGLFGMVLDRTNGPPRARVDGHTEILELAVRRLGSESTILVSPHLDLTLDVRSDGRMTVSAEGVPADRDTWLVRDADVPPLGPAVRETPAEAAAHAAQVLQAACGAVPKVDFVPRLRADEAAGAVATTWRAVHALAGTCRDSLGQRALTKEVRRIRIGAATASTFTLGGGTLVIQGDLAGESRGPFSDEIQRFVESKL